MSFPFLLPLLAMLAASPAPRDPAAHAAERDATCTRELFVVAPLPDGRRNYREKRSGVTFPSSVGRLSLAGCAVGEGGFEVYYQTDPANPVHERCIQQFQLRYIPGYGAQAHLAVNDMASRWGAEANPVFGNRRIGSGEHMADAWHASGATSNNIGKVRHAVFGYAKGEVLVIGAEDRIEDPYCNQGLLNSQTFLREFPWP